MKNDTQLQALRKHFWFESPCDLESFTKIPHKLAQMAPKWPIV